MISLQTIITSIISSSIISLGIIFILKKTFEKGIETKFKLIEDRNKLSLEEKIRREGKLFDDHYDLYKILVTLIYRIRNNYRGLLDFFSKNPIDVEIINKKIKAYEGYYRALDELLLTNRAILPQALFKELHDLKHLIHNVNYNISYLSDGGFTNDENKNILIEIKESYSQIDTHYNLMLAIIQPIMEKLNNDYI